MNKKIVIVGGLVVLAYLLMKGVSARPDKENQVFNGGFSLGLQGWTFHSTANYTTHNTSNVAIEGQSLEMNNDNGYYDIHGECICGQKMTLKEGQYKLRFYHKGTGGFLLGISTREGYDLNYDNPSDWISYGDGRTPYGDPVEGSYIAVNQDDDWTLYEKDITLPLGTGEYWIKIATRTFGSGWANRPSYIDNIEFKKIAEIVPTGVSYAQLVRAKTASPKVGFKK